MRTGKTGGYAMVEELTIGKVKKFCRSEVTCELVRDVLAKRAFAAAELARVDAYIAPVFASFAFTEGRRGRKITGPDNVWLCEDEELVAKYYAACDAAHKANGSTLPEGYCPALVADTAVRDAENALLKHAGENLDGSFGEIWNLGLRKRALEVLLSAPEA